MSSQPAKSGMNQQRRAGRRGVRGRALLLWRLAASDLRHQVAQAVLLLVAIASAATVLTLAFALNGVTTNPYQQTKAATNGPDAVAYLTSPSQVPLGIGLFKVAAKGLSGLPPALWLVAAVLGTLFAVAALTSVPARIGMRRPVAEILQAEAD